MKTKHLISELRNLDPEKEITIWLTGPGHRKVYREFEVLEIDTDDLADRVPVLLIEE